MRHENYHGYVLWGHAIAQWDELSEKDCYAASGTVTKGRTLAHASGALDIFEEEAMALDFGIAWARAWVDTHG
ncbi:transposase (plasmid) [Pararobbsia alpina]